jgi:sphingosine kinase
MTSSTTKKPLLVMINPASGTKVARKMFKTIVKPALEERQLAFEVMETEYAGHAEEFVKTCNDLVERFAGLITISGDGLLHEVYNGLATRPDWPEVCKIPVGIVPGGSGNALNCSLLRQLDQPLDGLNGLGANWSSLNVAVGAKDDKTIPLDLLDVELANGRKIISFLGVTIGLIADVDIGT